MYLLFYKLFSFKVKTKNLWQQSFIKIFKKFNFDINRQESGNQVKWKSFNQFFTKSNVFKPYENTSE